MIFLKLGGSLITEKQQTETLRPDTLKKLAEAIARYLDQPEREPILLGHGSGSFGHHAAGLHQTHRGASSPAQWRGFVEVREAAGRLNAHVLAALRAAGLGALPFPPSASAICANGVLETMAWEPIELALKGGLLPVVYGDVAFDRLRGSSIIATETIFHYLAARLGPSRVLLAGKAAGVYADYPRDRQVIPQLSPAMLDEIKLSGAAEQDVTGGMADKVAQAFSLARLLPGAEIRIFSGGHDLLRVLEGTPAGTQIVI